MFQGCPSRGGSSADGVGLGRGRNGHFVGTGIRSKCDTSWRGASISPAGTTYSANGSCVAAREHVADPERLSQGGSPSLQSAARADANLTTSQRAPHWISERGYRSRCCYITRRRVDNFVYPRSATPYRRSASIPARATGPRSPRAAAVRRYLIRTSPRRQHPRCGLEQATACTTSGRIPDRLGT